MATAHTTANPMVIRSRLRSATEDPPRELDMPPPNISDRPPPLPLCIRMRTIKNKLLIAKMVAKSITTVYSAYDSAVGIVYGLLDSNSSVPVERPDV